MEATSDMPTPQGASAVSMDADARNPSLNREEEEVSTSFDPCASRNNVQEAFSRPIRVSDGLALMPPRFRAKKFEKSIELYTWATLDKEEASDLLNFVGRRYRRNSDGSLDIFRVEKEAVVESIKQSEISKVAEVAEEAQLLKETESGGKAEQVPRAVRFALPPTPVNKNGAKTVGKKPTKKGGISLKGRATKATESQWPNPERLKSLRSTKARAELSLTPANMQAHNPAGMLEIKKKIEPELGGSKAERPVIKLPVRRSARVPKPSTKAVEGFNEVLARPQLKGSTSAPTASSSAWRLVLTAAEVAT